VKYIIGDIYAYNSVIIKYILSDKISLAIPEFCCCFIVVFANSIPMFLLYLCTVFRNVTKLTSKFMFCI